jgi:periplasmic glucans biosynthesis protein
MAFRRLLPPLLLALLLVLPGDAGHAPGPPGAEFRPGEGSAPAAISDPGSRAEIPPAPTDPELLLAWVAELARESARRPWVPPSHDLPPGLAGMDYDQHRAIRFRPEAALWRGETPFEVQFFHPGFLFPTPVRIHEVTPEGAVLLPFQPERFVYDGPAAPLAQEGGAGPGFAGFRVHYPLNVPDTKDEVVVFLGASYFRLLGAGHAHGLSSRGVAVNTTGPTREEFPDFREFWLIRPDEDARRLTFFALLDGPSLTGAYRFDLEPGAPTILEVEARLFAREDVGRLGVAPLTSMFLYGPEDAGRFDDFRPRVHDSDGLLLRTGAGEWIWRPLVNGPHFRATTFQDPDPRGFGLTQRARDFTQYLDLEARYHDRPSQWVEVGEGDWGEGVVELVEIPTNSEFHDNIVAHWVGDRPFRAGEERRYRYRLLTFDERLPEQTPAQVERTRHGWVALPGETDPPPRSHRRFVVDFAPGTAVIPEDPPVVAVLETSTGAVSDLRVQPLPGADPSGGGWRATFRFEPDGDREADLRLWLVQADTAVSETWNYLWVPRHD